MHPEIEEAIREKARAYLRTETTKPEYDELVEQNPIMSTSVGHMLRQISIYCRAAEQGVISFDDIYFLGVVSGAQTIAEERLIESGQAPISMQSVGVRIMPFVVQDDSSHRDSVSIGGYELVAELYNCTFAEAEERFHNINRKISDYHNSSL